MMAEKIGRFEIVSELAKSSFATVYKALDTENQQTVALKTVHLDQVQDRTALIKRTCDEADSAKSLSSHNIAVLYGVGDEGDLLLAATEYVQGNSVATTLGRHDGFSIWDIQDIARQVCQALDHAEAHKAAHQSLEPAKIMVQWEGVVKVLGFGISTMNSMASSSSNEVPEVLFYASPEQVRGDACDHRSALFSLGAVLYEMATEQKPFPGGTPEEVRKAILEQTPALPVRLKPNVNRALNDLIMKALAKSPDERYQSGQDLVRDLENCKSSNALGATSGQKAPSAVSKPKAQAAAAGAGVQGKPTSALASSGVIAPPVSSLPKMTASAAPALEEEKPAFAVDPMMAEEGGSAPARSSFSDISELPPLKEVRVSEPAPQAPAEEQTPPAAMPGGMYRHIQIEKPKIEIREAAEKAVAEIRKVPPKLVLYALGGAAVIIVLIMGMMSLQTYLADREESGNVTVRQAPAPQPVPQQPKQPEAVQQTPASEQAAQPAQPDSQETAAETTQPEEPTAPAERDRPSRRERTRAVAAAAAPAQLTVSSTPAGAQITFDGSALCQTPCTLTGIAAGAHTITATKGGFSAITRNISLAAGANAAVSLDLSQVSVLLSIASTPAGASIVIDGKDTGKLTPMQFSFSSSGPHTVTLKRYGYLDGTSSVNVEAGQSANVNLTLGPLGDTEEIRAAGGKFSKVFKKGEEGVMGIVSIKTQPKGAQIMVNQRVLDKTTPFDFYLNPGTYVIDVTMSGYKGVHRVVSVQEGEKLAIQETLAPE